jgi:hypothetical protein
VNGGVQIKRWLNLNGNFNNSWAIYYDPVTPFQGRSRSYKVGFTFQPNSKFNENITFNNVTFNRASNGERVFDVNILNTRSTYQFNKHFFLRAIAQYDSSTRRILTDFLASYEIVPGSVMHAGYGSLIEKRIGEPQQNGVPGTLGDYRTVSRGLFFKASYLHRF